jgi:transposase-like protein
MTVIDQTKVKKMGSWWYLWVPIDMESRELLA